MMMVMAMVVVVVVVRRSRVLANDAMAKHCRHWMILLTYSTFYLTAC